MAYKAHDSKLGNKKSNPLELYRYFYKNGSTNEWIDY